jgi:hypothetical protein
MTYKEYDSQDGNWMSGIKFMDELHLGSARQFTRRCTTK